MRILVSGSRGWKDKETIQNALYKAVLAVLFAPTIVHGGARGADSLAQEICEELHWKSEVHKADWNTFGRAAGYKRNREMAESGIAKALIFWDGTSPGTKHMIDILEELRIPKEVYVVQ